MAAGFTFVGGAGAAPVVVGELEAGGVLAVVTIGLSYSYASIATMIAARMPIIHGHIVPPALSSSRLRRRSSSGSRERSVNGSVCLGYDMSLLHSASFEWEQLDAGEGSPIEPI